MIAAAIASSGNVLGQMVATPSEQHMIDRVVSHYSTHGLIPDSILRDGRWNVAPLQILVRRISQLQQRSTDVVARAAQLKRSRDLRKLVLAEWGEEGKLANAPEEGDGEVDCTLAGAVRQLVDAADLNSQLVALEGMNQVLGAPVEGCSHGMHLLCDAEERDIDWFVNMEGSVEALVGVLGRELSRRSGVAKVSVIEVRDLETEYALLVATLTAVTYLSNSSIRNVFAFTDAGAIAMLVQLLEAPEALVRKVSVSILHRMTMQSGAVHQLLRDASGVAVLLNLIQDSVPSTSKHAAATLRCLDVLPPKQAIRARDQFEGLRRNTC